MVISQSRTLESCGYCRDPWCFSKRSDGSLSSSNGERSYPMKNGMVRYDMHMFFEQIERHIGPQDCRKHVIVAPR